MSEERTFTQEAARTYDSPRSGYVYLMQPKGHNVYKVGCTVNLDNRMKVFRRKYDFEVQVVATRFYDDYLAAERRWHKRFDAYHIIGEWFALPESAIGYFKSGVLS